MMTPNADVGVVRERYCGGCGKYKHVDNFSPPVKGMRQVCLSCRDMMRARLAKEGRKLRTK